MRRQSITTWRAPERSAARSASPRDRLGQPPSGQRALADCRQLPLALPATAGSSPRERQDLDEMLANRREPAKYGAGRGSYVSPRQIVDILIEDDGPGIKAADRGSLFTRGARLDTTGKPGTGLGLAIVRDVAEIYGGRITLEESEDLGGLMARLTLPAG